MCREAQSKYITMKSGSIEAGQFKRLWEGKWAENIKPIDRNVVCCLHSSVSWTWRGCPPGWWSSCRCRTPVERLFVVAVFVVQAASLPCVFYYCLRKSPVVYRTCMSVDSPWRRNRRTTSGPVGIAELDPAPGHQSSGTPTYTAASRENYLYGVFQLNAGSRYGSPVV